MVLPRLHSDNLIPLIKSCSSKTQLLQIHAHLITTSLFRSPPIAYALLSRFPPFDVGYAHLVFEQIPNPNIFHYNSVLNAYSQSNSPQEALHLYKRMKARGLVAPNAFSSSFVLKSCVKLSSLPCGKQVHARILRDGHRSDLILLTCLMDLYATFGDGEDALKVFGELPEKDTISWNVLISCYIRNRRSKDALQLFDLMQGPDYGLEPDDVTCIVLLQACAHLSALSFGERIHKYVEDKGYGGALKLRNSLIVMYSRCGCVEKAYGVFCDTQGRNVVTWSAMISGLAMNGYGKVAIEAFSEMRRVGVTPDEQTFTGLLSACSHSRLIDEGLKFFDMMKFEYGIAPNVHHYGCIVDLLGRAGMLDRAYKLIVNEMEVEPDATIWRTLLGACRIQGHVHLGERVVEHLVELKAEQGGDFVLLLNLYSSAGDWEKVAYVRKLMNDKGIQTTPGCTTIEVRGKVHEFIVGDDSHPRKVEIYEILDEIMKQLKIAGYVVNVSSELHCTGIKDKESALAFHGEKLAIAFGILSTPPGTTIRIANNLRICVDCHDFAKVLSTVYNRMVIVRDRSRFHHFQEGRCSCNDYW